MTGRGGGSAGGIKYFGGVLPCGRAFRDFIQHRSFLIFAQRVKRDLCKCCNFVSIVLVVVVIGYK